LTCTPFTFTKKLNKLTNATGWHFYIHTPKIRVRVVPLPYEDLNQLRIFGISCGDPKAERKSVVATIPAFIQSLQEAKVHATCVSVALVLNPFAPSMQ
jgi:hypothetical protein